MPVYESFLFLVMASSLYNYSKLYNAVLRRISALIFYANSYLLSRNTRLLRSALPSSVKPRRYLLVPYLAPDCCSLYRAIAIHYRLCGSHSAILDVSSLWSYLPRFIHKSTSTLDPDSLQVTQLYSTLSQSFSQRNISSLTYPVLDTLIRGMDISLLKGSINIDIHALCIEVLRIKSVIQELADQYDACFIPDSAYFLNSLFKQEFLRAGRDVYWLSPTGFLKQYLSTKDAEYGFHDDQPLPFYSQSTVDQYITRRFGGRAQTDLDTARAYSERPTSNWPLRKCLMLHAFRDANNLYSDQQQPFNSFIEWADFTFRVISESGDMQNWYIRPHPSAHLYENDIEILNHLLLRHGFAPSLTYEGPTLRQILEQKMPIYTCTGTVILEAPLFGFKAFFCGPRFPKYYGIYAKSRELWADYLMLNLAEAMEISSQRLEGVYVTSKNALYDMYGNRQVAALCPDKAIMPGDSGTAYLSAALSNCRNTIRTFFAHLT